MALSEKWTLEKARELLWNPDYTGFNPIAFTRAIEAEIRKQEREACALLAEQAHPHDWPFIGAAIRARARLEGKP